MTHTDNIITVNSLTKNYGKNCVINNVTFSVRRGEIYALVGKNGAGKTTVMKMLTGLIPENGGMISLFNETRSDRLVCCRGKIGALIEAPAFYPYMSAYDNLNYYRIQRGIKDKDSIDRILRTVGLENTGKKKFRHFSLGMKQRLGLALALLGEPELLILDEPINGLDPEGIIEVREILKRLNREKGVTILISSHILSELSLLADKFAFINRGRIIDETGIDEIKRSAGNETILRVDDIGRTTQLLSEKFPDVVWEIRNEDIIISSGYNDGIVPELTGNHIVIRGISTVSVSLEDYYIRLLKDDAL